MFGNFVLMSVNRLVWCRAWKSRRPNLTKWNNPHWSKILSEGAYLLIFMYSYLSNKWTCPLIHFKKQIPSYLPSASTAGRVDFPSHPFIKAYPFKTLQMCKLFLVEKEFECIKCKATFNFFSMFYGFFWCFFVFNL